MGDSVKFGRKNPKSEWWNQEVNTTVERIEAAWKDESVKERYLEIYKEEKRRVKRCLCKIKKEVKEQFGWEKGGGEY